MSVVRKCDECHRLIDWEGSRRPLANLCYVCALAIYIERLASFALKREPIDYMPKFVPPPGFDISTFLAVQEEMERKQRKRTPWSDE